MSRSYFSWLRFFVAFTVAFAMAIVWGIVATTIMGVVQIGSQQRASDREESLQIAHDGTPVIQMIQYGIQPAARKSLRTLDGNPWQGQLDANSGADLFSPKTTTLPRGSIGWNERVIGASDAQATSWYLVRPEDPLGPAYFVGYEGVTKRCVGYIARDGFHWELPSRDQWFELPRRRFGFYSDIIASSGPLTHGTRATNSAAIYEKTPPPQQGLQPWQLLLIDSDRLLQVDLRARTVSTQFQGPGLQTVAIVNEPQPASDVRADDDPSNDNDNANHRSMVLANGTIVMVGQFISQIALRTDDRIEIIDSRSGSSRKFMLPENLRRTDLRIYLVPGDSLLVTTAGGRTEDGYRTDIHWLLPDGQITRHESVRLLLRRMAVGETALMGAAAAPYPLVWLPVVASSLFNNVSREQPELNRQDATDATVFQLSISTLSVVGLAAVLMGFTVRMQRKYCRSATVAWCVFVFLLGAPGFVAYLIQQNKPKLETCTRCNAIVPRDREGCAACREVFRPPLLIGTEIYA